MSDTTCTAISPAWVTCLRKSQALTLIGAENWPANADKTGTINGHFYLRPNFVQHNAEAEHAQKMSESCSEQCSDTMLIRDTVGTRRERFDERMGQS